MADESVHVHIRITSDKREIAATRRELERLSAQARALNNDFADLNDTLDGNNDRQRRLQRNSQGTNRSLDSNGSAADRLGKKMRKTGKDMDFLDKSRKMLAGGLKTGLKFALIGATIEMVAMGAAIASVNALFGIGSASMKVYRFAMQGLAYAAAAGVAALATFAAAQREYNAAVTAFSYKSMPALGAGVNQSMAALRNLTSDSRVAVFGMQNLNAAFANVSKNAELTKPMQDALAGLGDFAVAAGGDIGKNFAQAAEFVGLLKKEGSLTADVMSAAGKVGPQFEKALKESGKTGADEILALMSSGTLAKSAGVEGALGAVNSTLMGQAKAFFTEMQGRFADLGQLFLPGVKKSFDQIQRIVRVTFMRISGSVYDFGTGKLLDDIVKVTDKLANLFVNLFDKYLPKSQQLFGGVGDLFVKMQGWWYKFVEGLDKLSEASRIINSAFGTAFSKMFEGFGGSLEMFAKLITDNEPKFVEFGNAMATAFKGIQDFFNGFKEFFVSNLPVISTLISGLGTILGLVGQVIGGISQMGLGKGAGAGGSIASLLTVAGLAYGVSKIAPNSKIGRVGGAIGGAVNRAGGAGSAPATRLGGGGPGMTGTMTMTASTVYLTTSRLIQNAPGMNRGGGVGNTPYGPMPTGGTPPPPSLTRGARAAQMVTGGGGQLVGSMAGIAAMSHFANPSANPFLTGGAMLSMFNPAAGLAVAGLGTAATSKTAAGGAVSGGIGGGAAGLFAGMTAAKIGGAIGTVITPGLGTAIGVAIGTAIGATTGYLGGQAQERDQGRARGREAVQGQFGGQFAQSLFGAGGPEGAMGVIEQAAASNDRAQTVFRQFKETESGMASAFDEFWYWGMNNDEKNSKVVEQMQKNGIELSQAEAELLATEPRLGSYFSSIQKQTEGLIGLEPALDHFKDQTSRLAGITGTTTKEISDLALKMGVDLLDPTRTLTENLKALGLATVKTAEQIAGANREIYVKTGEALFRAAKEFEQGQKALDQAAEGIRQTGKSTSSEQVRDFVQVLYDQALVLNRGDAGKAQEYINRAIFGGAGGTDKLMGDQFKNALGPLYGLEDIFQQVLVGDAQGRTVQQALLAGIQENTKRFNEGVATNVMTGIAGRGLQVAGRDENGLNTAIANQVKVLQDAISNPYAAAFRGENEAKLAQLQGLGQTITSSGLQGEDLATYVETVLRGMGITTDIMPQGPAGAELEGTAKEMHDAIVGAAKEGLGTSPDWLQNAPAWYTENQPLWWNSNPTWYSGGKVTVTDDGSDTSTPRAFGDATSSRLGRTMARHSYFDGTLPGKRTVTSAQRNFSLGSLKSDHLTGNAYDLTGQNLVGYANTVNSSGGFAEFHGSGGDRHLHVVPGQTPIGDSVSSMSPMVSGGSGGGSYAYTINVYPSAGQDSAAIAQEVMNRIEEKEKSVRERS